MKVIIFSILCAILFPLKVQAQMFSVDGDETERRANPFAPYLRAGVKVIDFSYQEDPSVLEESANRDLSFNGTAATLGFEAGGFEIGVSLGNELTGLDETKYFDLNLAFSNPFYFIRNEGFAAGVPLELGSTLRNVRNSNAGNDFSQTKLNIGAGAAVLFYNPEKFMISTQFLPHVGFSTASGGMIGGNVFSLSGKARVSFFNLLFGRNISFGYDYQYDSYNIDGNELDYDFSGHTITLGVSL